MNLLMVLILGISFLLGEASAKTCRTYHKVKAGESLWTISKKYRVSIRDLKRANPSVKRQKFLRVGQRLCIPKKKKLKTKAKRTKGYVIYRVRKGDTLEKIAKRFGVSVREIKRANGLRGDIIRVGQKLKIPKKAKRRTYRAKKEVVYITYRVRRGDSLRKIAKRFGVSWKEIKRVNRLKSDLIRVGQKLKIPVPKKSFMNRYAERPKVRLSFLPVNGKIRRSGNGLEIIAPCGEKVKAVAKGKVIYSGDDLPSYGNMIMIEHKGFISVYAYNMQNLVERGDLVDKGEVIAKVGIKPSLGRCALLFEMRYPDGSVINPLSFLKK